MADADGFFDPINCTSPFFIVTGLNNDNIISDRLTVSDFKTELHKTLLKQGFDAVIFLDTIRMLHFYDVRSSFILRFGRFPTDEDMAAIVRGAQEENLERPANAQMETQPVEPVIRHHRRTRTQVAAQADPNAVVARAMNLGLMSWSRVWPNIGSLLANPSIRTALVVNDLMQVQLKQGNEGDFQKYLTPVTANRAHNKNIVIFCTNAANNTTLQECLIPQAATSSWSNFATHHLLPLINNSDDDTDNDVPSHILRILPPNASEIRNLFTMLSLREGRRLNTAELPAMCSRMSSYAREHGWSAADLLNRLRRENQDLTMDMALITRLCGGSRYRNVQEQLNDLVGMDNLKEYFRELADMMHFVANSDPFAEGSSRITAVKFRRAVRGHSLNIILVGRPGTGKSTAARLIAGMYRELGLLPLGHTVSTSAAALETAASLHEYVRRAIGGVLVIDEAYALMNRPQGQDVIDALVADMGTYAGQFAVVFAGYKEQTERLLESNDGLARRIGRTIELEDYSWVEIEDIFFSMARSDESVDASRMLLPENQAVTNNVFKGWVLDAGPHWGNAGEAEKLLNEMKKRCAARMAAQGLSEDNGHVLMLEPADFPEEMEIWATDREQNITDAYKKLDELIGLTNVKNAVYSIARGIKMHPERQVEPGFYIFQGPPGTGKSMIADLMGFIFQKLGVIRRRKPVIYTARQILERPKAKSPGEIIADSPNSLMQALAESEDAILFIDEAHQLARENGGGRKIGEEVVSALIPLMEQESFRRHHCIILAGYVTEMAKLIDMDSGFSSRFPLSNRLTFKNYTAKELRQILELNLKRIGETADQDFLARAEVAFSKYLASQPANFGNGRFIRNEFIPNAQSARDDRLAEAAGAGDKRLAMTDEQVNSITEIDRKRLTKFDLPRKPVNFHQLAGPVDAPLEGPLTAEKMAEQLFGKEEIKAFIKKLSDRESYSGSIHYTICGPLGSGKEEAICAIANTLAEHEFIDSREVYIYGNSDLVAQYVGQTGPKTRAAVTNAQGATVVMASPSTLLLRNNDSDNSFGPEAISEFISCMGAFGNNTSFVIMDTEEGMEQFTKAYPLVRSRFEKHFVLEDLDIDTMQKLFRLKTEKKMIFDDSIAGMMNDMVANWVSDRGGLGAKFNSWANGDEIEQLIAKLKDNWTEAGGVLKKNDFGVMVPVITRDMFPQGMRDYIKPTYEDKKVVLETMKKEIGLTGVKAAITGIETKMRRFKADGIEVMPGNYCFVGNPGSGKTRMAKKLGSVLRATDVLSQGMVITRTAREMCAQRHEFDKLVRLARENILFIDEAHQLYNSAEGLDVIQRLLTVLEDVEVTRNTCFVLAGYEMEMQRMFDRDAGLRSRFGTKDSIIRFDDYNEDELLEILKLFGKNAAKEPQVGGNRAYDLEAAENAPFMEEARSCFHYVLSMNDREFGNARFARNLLHDAINHQLLRLDKLHPNNEPIPDEEMRVLLPEDIPNPPYRREMKRQGPSSRNAVPAAKLQNQQIKPIDPANIAFAYAEIEKSIVLLEMADEKGSVIGYGTGFFISEDGVVLTCDHVVKQASSARVRMYYRGMIGGERWFDDCEILRPSDSTIDMGLIKINHATGFQPLPLRPADEPIITGESTVIYGYPFGDALRIDNDPKYVPSVFNGSVASSQALGSDQETVMMNGEGKHGNSGSPVIAKADGRVIGVFSGSKPQKSGDLVEEINYFRPIRLAWKYFFH